MRILVAGYQHETNTFAPSPADWAAFLRGDGFPAYSRGAAMLDTFRGVNAPMGGFIDAARAEGWTLLPSCWAGATPSSYVSAEAFEHISRDILEDLEAALPEGLDAVYLDLHGAAAAEHAWDSEAELLERLRRRVGPQLPIVASLDLHANVTPRMLELADALVAYRTYPHVDMAQTGQRAAELLRRRLQRGSREPIAHRRLPFLIPLNAQSTWLQPAQAHYALLDELQQRTKAVPSFCMGFPAADFEGCAPMVWAHGERAAEVVETLFAAVNQPEAWRLEVLSAEAAVALALDRAAQASRPVVVADTQDNPGAGGDGNTTGLLHALRAQRAGHRLPGRVCLGMLFDQAAAQRAHAVGVGGRFEGTIGRAVPYFGGTTDAPVQGLFTVKALSDGVTRLKGPMMTGMSTGFGPSACLEIEGIQVAVVSGKAQLLDREMLRMVGIVPEAQGLIVVKSSNHFRADFTPIADSVIVAKAPGPMAVDPADLPWQHLSPEVRTRP